MKKATHVIHPRCPIEEYANIFRILICFSPPHPPIKTDNMEQTTMISDETNFESDSNKNIGAIFCQHAIIIVLRNGSPLNTSGNQKWHGARPNFIINAAVIIK